MGIGSTADRVKRHDQVTDQLAGRERGFVAPQKKSISGMFPKRGSEAKCCGRDAVTQNQLPRAALNTTIMAKFDAEQETRVEDSCSCDRWRVRLETSGFPSG
jgi:hypothetical protein